MKSDTDKAWFILPEVQSMIHRCTALGAWFQRTPEGWNMYTGYSTPVQITAHLSRPDEALSVSKGWEGPVMESRAACGCVRYRAVHAFELKPVGKGGELEVCVLLNSKTSDLRPAGGASC